MKKIAFIILILAIAALNISLVQATDKPNFQEKSFDAKAQFITDELIVKFKPGVDESEIKKIDKKLGSSLISQIDQLKVRKIKVMKSKVQEIVKEYQKNPNVEYAEPNYIATALMVPNDPYYSYQWHFDNLEYGGINMESAWDITSGDPGVILAVLDTGVAYENYTQRNGWRRTKYYQAPDLANTNFVQGYDFINNDTHPNDDKGHGTHVTGTLAQSTNNNLGVAGISFNISIMPIKVLDVNGLGSYADVAQGIIWATDHGAKVINLSLGGTADSQTLEDAVAYAYNHGVTIVAAAGNGGPGAAPNYPAAYDNYVIAVGATIYDEQVAYYSSTGSYIDLTAPGGDLNVDQNNDSYGDGILQQTFSGSYNNFGYWFYQGTSMATPHVAGVVALILSNGNATSPDEVRIALQNTAEDHGPFGWDESYGYGIVNAYAALNYTSEPNSPPVANDQFVITDEDTSSDITLTATDPDSDPMTYSIVDQPTNGTLIGTVPNVTYLPDENYNGLDGFTFQANDGKTNSNLATISITINSINDVPLADNQSVTTPQDTNVNITLTASDVDDDVLNFETISQPSYGALTGTAPNLVYTPEPRFIGSDSFTFKVNDGELESNIATVSITVTETPEQTLCWDEDYKYLKRNSSQIRKFCKCAQGNYVYKSYSSLRITDTAYQFVDSGDNENWQVTPVTTLWPVYRVKCSDGQWYEIDQDYYY